MQVPEIMRVLEQCDADIMCLQEVTPSFLAVLAQQKWMQDKYMLSEASPTTAATIDPYGQVCCAHSCLRGHTSLMIALISLFFRFSADRQQNSVRAADATLVQQHQACGGRSVQCQQPTAHCAVHSPDV